MATFKVLRRVDAYADYVAAVEADSPEAVAILAADAPCRYHWVSVGTQEFDDRKYVALDADQLEIEHTAQGDPI